MNSVGGPAKLSAIPRIHKNLPASPPSGATLPPSRTRDSCDFRWYQQIPTTPLTDAQLSRQLATASTLVAPQLALSAPPPATGEARRCWTAASLLVERPGFERSHSVGILSHPYIAVILARALYRERRVR